ncbi:MAG: YaeQ family protein [Burkholderiales bacterium]|nr:YaeQ family protein [Burkholderiales bacterium]
MAIKSTIFKANLSVADIDRGYYADHALTIARHPSENDERMMMRLAAFALNAHEVQTLCNGDATLTFGGGLSTPDDPDVVLRDFTGATRLWIEVGQPDETPIARACRQADQVAVYAFHHAAEVWWKGLQNKVARYANLSVWRMPAEESQALATMAERSMQLQATVQEGSLLLADARTHVSVHPVRWK